MAWFHPHYTTPAPFCLRHGGRFFAPIDRTQPIVYNMAKPQSQKGFLTLVNRKELTKAVAANTMLTEKQADAALTAIVTAIE